MEKIKTRQELTGIINGLKKEGKKVGFTNGCFDILHLGHIRYLEEARGECDALVIGVNSDSSVKRIKGPERPVNSEKARIGVLAALECVDFVTLFQEDTPLSLIKDLSPDMLFKGGDWSEGEIVGSDHVKSSGGEVRVIPFVEGYSTTGIINKLKADS